MPVRSLVPAAQDDWDRTLLKDSAGNLPKRALRIFQVADRADIAEVQQPLLGQADAFQTMIGCKPIQPTTNSKWGASCAGPALIATHAFVGRKTDEDRLSRQQRDRSALPKFRTLSQAGVVGAVNKVGRRLDRFKPRKPLVRA